MQQKKQKTRKKILYFCRMFSDGKKKVNKTIDKVKNNKKKGQLKCKTIYKTNKF